MSSDDDPDSTQGFDHGWPVTPYTAEIRALLGAEPPPVSSCCIAYLGGCTVRGGARDGARVGRGTELAAESQFHLAVRLRRAFPGQSFIIRNFAEAGVTAGGFLARGGVELLRKALPRLRIAFLRYGIADRKAEGIPRTIEHLGAVCDRLQEAFPLATLIIETDVWVDYPRHYLWDRNIRLAPLYARIREFAAGRGYPLVDIYALIEAETRRGNWDLRQRAVPADSGSCLSDDTFDTFFGDDVAYFTDVHPNSRGLALIAEWETAKLRELFGERLPA